MLANVLAVGEGVLLLELFTGSEKVSLLIEWGILPGAVPFCNSRSCRLGIAGPGLLSLL